MEAVLDAYVAAWNETDAARRRGLLAESVVEEFVFEGLMGELTGHDALDRLIDALQRRMPGGAIERTGPASSDNGGGAVFGWRIVSAAGETVMAGTDAVEVADDGRLRRLEVRIGPPT